MDIFFVYVEGYIFMVCSFHYIFIIYQMAKANLNRAEPKKREFGVTLQAASTLYNPSGLAPSRPARTLRSSARARPAAISALMTGCTR